MDFLISMFSLQFCLYFLKQNHYTKKEIDDTEAQISQGQTECPRIGQQSEIRLPTSAMSYHFQKKHMPNSLCNWPLFNIFNNTNAIMLCCLPFSLGYLRLRKQLCSWTRFFFLLPFPACLPVLRSWIGKS